MNEHEAMGKLVKEIADVLNQWRKCGRLECTPDIPLSIYKKDCPDILEITEGESAKSLITLILSAVRDGRLDEELGVVGRWNLTDIYEPTGKWLQSWLKEMMFDKDMHTLIALRKEEK